METRIYTATAVGKGRAAISTVGRLYSRGKPPVLILKEAEWTPGQEGLKKNLHHMQIFKFNNTNYDKKNGGPSDHYVDAKVGYSGRPVRSQAPCRLSYLASYKIQI